MFCAIIPRWRAYTYCPALGPPFTLFLWRKRESCLSLPPTKKPGKGDRLSTRKLSSFSSPFLCHPASFHSPFFLLFLDPHPVPSPSNFVFFLLLLLIFQFIILLILFLNLLLFFILFFLIVLIFLQLLIFLFLLLLLFFILLLLLFLFVPAHFPIILFIFLLFLFLSTLFLFCTLPLFLMEGGELETNCVKIEGFSIFDKTVDHWKHL